MKAVWTKAITKGLLRRAGLEVRRVKKPAQFHFSSSKQRESGWVLEFIGVSGIGKTTLINKSLPRLGSGWGMEREISNYYFPNGYRFLPDSYDLSGVEADFVCAYVRRKFRYDTRLMTFDQKVRSSGQHLSRLGFHVLAESDLPVGIVMNEGLVMNFGEELVQYREKSARISSMLRRRLLVSLCCRDTISLLGQIRKRHEKQPGHTGYMGLSDEEIVRSLEQQQKDKARWIQALEPHLGGVLKLDTSDGLEANSTAVVEFVEKVVERKQ